MERDPDADFGFEQEEMASFEDPSTAVRAGVRVRHSKFGVGRNAYEIESDAHRE